MLKQKRQRKWRKLNPQKTCTKISPGLFSIFDKKEGKSVQKIIHKIRDKYTYWLLLLFVPLEVLPFLCEPDSMMGKVLLLVKAVLFGVLYILYLDKQKWYIHVMLFITCVSMGVSVLIHGGIGTALLIMIMFSAICVFPRIELTKEKRNTLFLLLGIGAASMVVTALMRDYQKGLPAFFYKGTYNTNMVGILLLSSCFYWVSILENEQKGFNTWLCVLVLLLFSYMIIRSSCRSALLAFVVFVLCLLIRKTKYEKLLYYVISSFSIMICFVILYLEHNTDIPIGIDNFNMLGKKLMSGREKIWDIVLSEFLQAPFTGQASDYLYQLTGYESTHNVFMGIMFSFGLIPCLCYLKIILSPSLLLSSNSEKMLRNSQICFVASIIISAFECVYTDNRLNLLFLPLLICEQKDHMPICQLSCNNSNYRDQYKNDGELLISRFFATSRHNRMITYLTMIVFAVVIFEPVALSITHDRMPRKVNQNFLNEIGYGDSKVNVLDSYNGYSEQCWGIIWSWNNSMYDVVGTAEQYTARNYFYSVNSLPEWATPGKEYHVIYEADEIRLRIYYYSQEGKCCELVNTLTSVDFTIPEGSTGLLLFIEINEGQTVFESVAPIIYAIENEPIEMKRMRDSI